MMELALFMLLLVSAYCAQIPVTGCMNYTGIGDNLYLTQDLTIPFRGSPCLAIINSHTIEVDGRGFKLTYQSSNSDDYKFISVDADCASITFKNLQVFNAAMEIAGTGITISNVTIMASSNNVRAIISTEPMANVMITGSRIVSSAHAVKLAEVTNLVVENTYLSGTSGLFVDKVIAGRFTGNTYYIVDTFVSAALGYNLYQITGNVVVEGNTAVSSPGYNGVGFLFSCTSTAALTARDNYVTTRYVAKQVSTTNYWGYDINGCKGFQFLNNTADKVTVNLEIGAVANTPIYGGVKITASNGDIEGCDISLAQAEVPRCLGDTYSNLFPKAIFGIYLTNSEVNIKDTLIHDIYAPSKGAYADEPHLAGVRAAGIFIDTDCTATSLTNVRIVGVYGSDAGKVYYPSGSAGVYELTGGDAYGILWEDGDLTIDGLVIDQVVAGNGVRVEGFANITQCSGGKAYYWKENSNNALTQNSAPVLSQARNGSDCGLPVTDMTITSCGIVNAILNAKVMLDANLTFTTNCIIVTYAYNSTFYGNGHSMSCSGSCFGVFGIFVTSAHDLTFADMITYNTGAVFATLSNGSISITNGYFKDGNQHLNIRQYSNFVLGHAYITGCKFYNTTASALQVGRNAIRFYSIEIRGNYFQDMKSLAVETYGNATFVTGNTFVNTLSQGVTVETIYGAVSHNTFSVGHKASFAIFAAFQSLDAMYRDISNNIVENFDYNALSTFYAIFVMGLDYSSRVPNITINNNIVRNISVSCGFNVGGFMVTYVLAELNNNTVDNFIVTNASYDCPPSLNPAIASYVIQQASANMINCNSSNIHGLPTRASTAKEMSASQINTDPVVQALIVTLAEVIISDSYFDGFYGPDMPGCNCSSASALSISFATVTPLLPGIPLYQNTALIVDNVQVSNFYGGKGGDITNFDGDANAVGGDVVGFYNYANASITVANSRFTTFIAGAEGQKPGVRLPCNTGRAEQYVAPQGTIPIFSNVIFNNFVGSNACKKVEGCATYTLNDTYMIQARPIYIGSMMPIFQTCIYIVNSTNLTYIGFFNNFETKQNCNALTGITVVNSKGIEVTQLKMLKYGFTITGSEDVTLSQSRITGGGVMVRMTEDNVKSASIINNTFLAATDKYCINATHVKDLIVQDNNCGLNAGILIVATGAFNVRNNTISSSNKFALEITGLGGVVEQNLVTNSNGGIYVRLAGPPNGVVSNISGNVVLNSVPFNRDEFYGFQFQCDGKHHVKATNNEVQSVRTNQTNGSIIGISARQCFVDFDSNTITGMSQEDFGHSEPMYFMGYELQAVNGTIKNSIVSELKNNINYGASVVYGLTAFGFGIVGGSLSLTNISIANITALSASNCTNCNDASGHGAVGFYINSAQLEVNGLTIDGLRAGDGGNITTTVPSGDYASLGGDVSAVWVLDTGSTVQIANAQYRNFKAGNGGYFDNANSTTCAGGKANLKYGDCYECGNRISFLGGLVYNLDGANGVSCLGDASSTTAIWPMDTSTLTTTTTTTTITTTATTTTTTATTTTTTGTTTDITTTDTTTSTIAGTINDIATTDTTTHLTTTDTTTIDLTTTGTTTTAAIIGTTTSDTTTTAAVTTTTDTTTTNAIVNATTVTTDTTIGTSTDATTTTTPAATTDTSTLVTTTTSSQDSTTTGQTTTASIATTGASTSGVVPGIPTGININKTRTTITLSWTAPLSKRALCETFTFTVGLSNNSVDWNDTNIGSGLGRTIMNLTPNTTYFFRIAAVGSAGRGGYAFANVTTNPLSVPATPLKPTYSSFDRTFINVVWAQPDDGGLPILEYSLQVLNSSGSWFNLLKNNSNSYRFGGLSMSTKYQFRVAVANSMGYSNFSDIAELSTAQRECGDGTCDAGFETCKSCFLDCFSTCPTNNKCPGTPQCSGRGDCSNGLCVCTAGWSGSSCDLEDVPVVIIVNNTVPVTSTTVENQTDASVGVTFVVSFYNIHERSPDGNTVGKSFLFSEQNFTVTLANNTAKYQNTTVFTTVLLNKAIVSIYVSTFSNDTLVPFANHTIAVSAKGFKYAMKVENWPFAGYGNKLIVTMDSNGASLDPEDDCVTVDTSGADIDNLRWLKVTVNGVVLYGKFADYALIDNVEKVVQFSYSMVSKLVEITMPHFWNNAEFDPDFQVLLSNDDPDDGCISNSKKLNSGKIAGITVGVVVGVALVIAAIGYVYLRHNSVRTRKRLISRKSSEMIKMTSTSPLNTSEETRH